MCSRHTGATIERGINTGQARGRFQCLVSMQLQFHSVFTDAVGIRSSSLPLVAIASVGLGLHV